MTDFVNGLTSTGTGKKQSRDNGAAKKSTYIPKTRTTAPARTFSEIVQERAERQNQTASGRSKNESRFRLFYIIYCSVLLFIFIAGTLVFTFYLNAYEQSQPYVAAENISEIYNRGSISVSEFLTENADILDSLDGDTASVIEAYASQFNNSEDEFTYAENAASTDGAPVFDILYGEDTVARITLASSEGNFIGISDWSIASLEIANYITDSLSYEILVPTGGSLTVNGTLLDASYMKAQNTSPSLLADSAAYISAAPTYDIYYITGLVNEPSFYAEDATGRSLNITRSNAVVYCGDYASGEFISEVSERVTSATESWATFFIGKSEGLTNFILAGSKCYSDVFESGTYSFVADYANITDYTFSETRASNYIRYSDDCFSVDISYVLNLSYSEDSPRDSSSTSLNATWLFVYSGGAWYISDILYSEENTP